jgi:REP element-mobilizing transposase RayT
MKYNPNIHHRRSIRLRDYDYSQSGAYFITICTYQKEYLFGEIINYEMQLNSLGKIVQFYWQGLKNHYDYLQLDEFVIMPNHLHGILILINTINPTKRKGIPEIIRGFKTFSAKKINQIRQRHNVPVWQRNYYEHIIRNESDFNPIREYILNNPKNWSQDPENV